MIRDRRSPGRLLAMLARWLLSPLEEKRDGFRRLSMTRCAVAAFTSAYVFRLVVIRDPLGWPDAWLAFAVLFALPIGKAHTSAPAEEVIQAVASMFGRGGSPAGGYYTSTMRTASFAPDGPGVLSAEDLTPPVAHGRPIEAGER